MASKKTKRPGSARPAQGRVTTTTDTPSVRPAPAAPGGPNRIQRKEDARRQREQIQRRMARRQLLRRGGWISVGVAVAVVAALLIVTNRKTGGTTTSEETSLLHQSVAAQKAAGCSAVQTIKPYSPESLDRAHIGSAGAPTSMPAISSYPSQPPTSGPHNPTPLNAGVYQDPPPLDQAIHSLEHASVIVWYSPSAGSNPEVVKIQSFALESNERDHLIVAPYDYPQAGGQLPAGKQMVLVAWHRMMTCDTPSLAAAFGFIHAYRVTSSCDTKAYKGTAPEPCVGI